MAQAPRYQSDVIIFSFCFCFCFGANYMVIASSTAATLSPCIWCALARIWPDHYYLFINGFLVTFVIWHRGEKAKMIVPRGQVKIWLTSMARAPQVPTIRRTKNYRINNSNARRWSGSQFEVDSFFSFFIFILRDLWLCRHVAHCGRTNRTINLLSTPQPLNRSNLKLSLPRIVIQKY